MSTDYAALADTININKITYNRINRSILRKLKENDENFTSLYIRNRGHGYDYYIADSFEELGWLGYFIRQNTKLQELHIFRTIRSDSFYNEMSSNTTIQRVFFSTCDDLNVNNLDISDGKMFRMLAPFFKNNQNLYQIQIERCISGIEGARQLSLAIRNCNKWPI